jgi:hypothetical protein
VSEESLFASDLAQHGLNVFVLANFVDLQDFSFFHSFKKGLNWFDGVSKVLNLDGLSEDECI